MGFSAKASFLSLLFASASLVAQEKPRQEVFTERVEVNVRMVVVVVTDRQGKHPASAPSTLDLEVREDGTPAEIVSVEPVPRQKSSGSGVAVPPATVSESKIVAPIEQVLYVDRQFIYRGSAHAYVQTLSPLLEAMAARGPLRIVVAGPNPRDLLPTTDDAGLARAALKKLPEEASGTDSLFESRRRLLDSPPVRDWEMVARVFIARDIERIEASFEKLELWAAANRPASPTVLYLVSDGFELDPTDFYLNCRKFCPPSAILEREKFRNTFASRVPRAVSRTSAELVSLGFTVVPVTIGIPPVFKAAGPPEQQPISMRRSIASAIRSGPSTPVSLAWQPADSLSMVAEATGGEVTVGEARLRKALERFDDAYIVAYKFRAAGKSGVLNLEVRSTRPELLVRAAHATAGGTASSEILARSRAAAALARGGTGGPLPVAVRLEGLRSEKKGLTAGTLVVTTDLGASTEALAKAGRTRARVTLAVETDDPIPFLTSQEGEVGRTGAGTIWIYEVPMTWPKSAHRVSVLVEELTTGLFGTASVDLPR